MAKKRRGQVFGEITEAEAPSWDRFGGMLDLLAVAEEGQEGLAAEYLRLTQQANDIEARKKEIREIVGPCLIAVGEDKVRGDGWLAMRFKSHKPTRVSETKLLEQTLECPHCQAELGIPMDSIEASREGGDEYWVTTITKVDKPKPMNDDDIPF